MKQLTKKGRTLAYTLANVIPKERLDAVSGGTMAGSTIYTTKQTLDTNRNWDVGGDINWD